MVRSFVRSSYVVRELLDGSTGKESYGRLGRSTVNSTCAFCGHVQLDLNGIAKAKRARPFPATVRTLLGVLGCWDAWMGGISTGGSLSTL
jgi:hypothetical protein